MGVLFAFDHLFDGSCEGFHQIVAKISGISPAWFDCQGNGFYVRVSPFCDELTLKFKLAGVALSTRAASFIELLQNVVSTDRAKVNNIVRN